MLAKIRETGTQLGVGAMTLFLGAQHALAQATGPTTVGESGGDDVSKAQPIKILNAQDGGLLTLIGRIVNIILIVVGVLAVIYLIYGGIMYITAGGDAEKANKGRVAITNAIIGIVIIMLALAIYNFVIQGVGSNKVS